MTLAAVLLAGCSQKAPRSPNVLLVTIDTLRPDALGWVSGANATPQIDALAREGTAFAGAVSPAPLTLPAHASLMTGLLPRRHGARDNGQVLSTEPRTLAEILQATGYRTAAFVSGAPLRRLYGLDRGFQTYDDALPTGGSGWEERPAPETTSAALAWVRGQPAVENAAPWFLWVHYYDPHDPYEPPERLVRPGPRGAYDGEVALVDESVGALRRGIADASPGAPLLTILAADHGESLGEHGEETHGFFLYDATVLVPIVVHMPGRVAPGRSDLPVRLHDLAPTVLSLLGAPVPAGIDGVDLAPALSGNRQEIPPCLLETLQPWLGYGWSPLAAIRRASDKLVDAPRREVYDLARDPKELQDIAGSDAARRRELEELLAQALAVAPAGSKATDDPEALRQLQALGYVGAGSTEKAPTSSLADPKDRIDMKRDLTRGEQALQAGDHAGSLAIFDSVLGAEPENRYALLRSAAALGSLGRHGEAASRLERLIALDPLHAEAAYQLADMLSRAGDLARGMAAWQRVVELQPRRAVAWSNLGALQARSGDARGALAALEKAVAVDPSNPGLRRNLAELRYAVAFQDAVEGRLASARQGLDLAFADAPELRERAAGDPRLKVLLPDAP